MSRLLVFQHVAAEPLGTLDARIRARGHRIRFHNFQRDPDAQPNVDRYRGLIVLGGPMNVGEQDRHPHLTTELKAIEAALRQDKPVLGVLGERAPVFQWHGCTWGLPSGAVQLARTDTCEQQAFRWGSNAYGFQFHLEADAAMIGRWLTIDSYREELEAAGLGHDAEAIRAATTVQIARMQPLAEAVFNSFLDLVGRPNRRTTLPTRA